MTEDVQKIDGMLNWQLITFGRQIQERRDTFLVSRTQAAVLVLKIPVQ